MKLAWHISSAGFTMQRAMPATPLAIQDLLLEWNARLANVIENLPRCNSDEGVRAGHLPRYFFLGRMLSNSLFKYSAVCPLPDLAN